MALTAREREDRKIVSRLRRSQRGRTAADLGTTSARLRSLGAVVVGKIETGKAGRPALLFSLPNEESSPAGESE